MVVVKVGVVVLVILFGFAYVDAANWTPLIPPVVTDPATGATRYGLPGVFTAAGVIFFAYIGFESVSTAAQEAVNPQRNMPIGILGALAICTVLYILMCLVITAVAGGLMGGLSPIGLLGELASVGTLLAFAMICAGVMYLRIRHPELPRSFRTPLWWLTAPLGIASCLYLIASLPVATFWRLLVWMGIGLVVYVTYAFWHSRYNETAVVPE